MDANANMKERRKLKRRYLMFYSRVFDRKSGRLLGYISDLTQEGTMLISDEPIEPDLTYRLSMDLPEESFDKDKVMFDARCIWCKPDIDPHFYIAGFQLIDVDPEDVEIIDRIVQEYGFRDSTYT